MNIFFAVCWGASYLAMLTNFILWGWRWSEEIATAQAMAFWLLLTLAFGGIGLYLVRSIRT